jgi:hypothetical protein
MAILEFGIILKPVADEFLFSHARPLNILVLLAVIYSFKPPATSNPKVQLEMEVV